MLNESNVNIIPNRLLVPAGYTAEANIWDRIYAVMRQKHTIIGNISSIYNYNDAPVWEIMIPEFPEQRALVPIDETGLDEIVFNKMVGQDVYLRIQGVDQDNNLLACSYSEAVEAVKDMVVSRLAPGKRIPVVIKAIAARPTRLIVDIGGGVLVEIGNKEARRYYSRYLTEQYQPGQQIEADILSVDPVQLTLRTVYGDPWQQYSFARGQIVVATVIQVFEEYMTLECDMAPGMIGTAPVPIFHTIFPGDRVQCSVTRFLRDDRKLNLRVRSRVK